MRLMTAREALQELQSIINDEPNPNHMKSLSIQTRQERINFLFQYIESKLPADPDWDAMAKRGILA